MLHFFAAFVSVGIAALIYAAIVAHFTDVAVR